MLNLLKVIALTYLWLSATDGFAQSDTINQVDVNGKRTGFWIITGEMRPDKGYCDSCVIEKGTYYEDRKNGQWFKYYKNSSQVRLIGNYKNNRPYGPYEKFNEKGCLIQKGFFNHSKLRDTSWVFNKDSCFLEKMTIYGDDGRAVHSYLFYPDSCLRQHLNYESKFQDSITISYYSKSRCGLVDSTSKRYVGPMRTKCDWGGTADVRPVLKYNGDCDYFEILDTLKNGQHRILDSLGRKIIDAQIEDGWIKKGKMWCYNERGDALEYNYKNKSVKSFSRSKSEYSKAAWVDLDGTKGQVLAGNIFDANGYNKVFNNQTEIWMDGEFKNGLLYNGKYYIYDADGILEKIRIYKNGHYIADGQLN